MGRDKIEIKLKELSLYIELGNFKKASELLSEISDVVPSCSREDAKKILEFLNFYSHRLKQLEEKLGLEAINKLKVRKSYLR